MTLLVILAMMMIHVEKMMRAFLEFRIFVMQGVRKYTSQRGKLNFFAYIFCVEKLAKILAHLVLTKVEFFVPLLHLSALRSVYLHFTITQHAFWLS